MKKINSIYSIVVFVSIAYSCASDPGGTKEITPISTEDSGVSNSCAKACQAVPACESLFTYNDCYQLYCVEDDLEMDPSSECISAIESASCEEHEVLGIFDSYYDICLPKCNENEYPTCHGDSISGCWFVNGIGEYRRSTVTCDSLCALDDYAYSGFCGKRDSSGQVSPTGHDTCWCE